MLVAHRGFRSPNGENRMIDFRTALKTCKAVEFDIRLTKDKKIIIFHDHHLRRIGNQNATIRQMTYDEIKNLPFFKEHPEFLPPLFIEDFVNKIAANYEMINVEIKPDRYTESEFEQLRSALEMLRQKTKAEIIVSSFGLNALKFISTLDSKKFKKGYLFENPGEIDWSLIHKFDYVHPSVGTVKNPKNKDLFKKINLPMNIWTFKNNDDVQKVKALYPTQVHGWISDKQDLKI